MTDLFEQNSISRFSTRALHVVDSDVRNLGEELDWTEVILTTE